MTRAFRAEWVKLARPALLLGTTGAMAAFVVLANFGMFRIASMQSRNGEFGQRGAQRGFNLATAVSFPDGWLVGLRSASMILAVVSLVVFASNVGGEYKNGTLRFLLAGEPRRLHLLAGKVAALSTLVLGAVLVTMFVALGTAYLFAAMFGLATGPWLSGEGLKLALEAFFNVGLTSLAWGLIGAALAIVLRTSAAAIGTGVGYLLVGEAIISRAIVASLIDVESAWFPGEVLRVVASGGSPASSYLRAALLALLYVGCIAAGGAALFQRRDVVT
jgi:ABC-2 type transport system permease protein